MLRRGVRCYYTARMLTSRLPAEMTDPAPVEPDLYTLSNASSDVIRG